MTRAWPEGRGEATVTRLVLVRHGESTWNAEWRIQGQAGSGLTEVGHEQAKHTAAWLADSYPEAALFSSDLQRCRETAAPLADHLGTGPTLDEGLRERRFGDWEGLLRRDVERRDADRWARWRLGEDVIGEIGGESSVTLARRASAAFEGILAQVADGGVAIAITHGGTVWHGVHELLGLSHGILGRVANTAIAEIVVDEEWTGRSAELTAQTAPPRWLDGWNQATHLPAHLRTVYRPSEEVEGHLEAPRPGS